MRRAQRGVPSSRLAASLELAWLPSAVRQTKRSHPPRQLLALGGLTLALPSVHQAEVLALRPRAKEWLARAEKAMDMIT